MREDELTRYLSSAKRKLHRLGPIERRRVLARIRQDVMELAADGMIEPPGSEHVRRAISAMPEPEKLAMDYIKTSHPPDLLIRIASGLNSLLGLAAAIVAGFILSSILRPHGWTQPIFFVGVILLLLSGVFVFAAYVLAIISPHRASRIRYVTLVPMTLCIIIDGLMVLWMPLQIASYAIYGIVLFVLFLCGGVYSVSYVHDQLPRPATVIPASRNETISLPWIVCLATWI
jgi:MFS family permease